MTPVTISVRLVHPRAQLPRFAHSSQEEAGMDLYAAEEARLKPGEWAVVPTGLILEIPPGYEGQVRPRSGLALRHGVTLLNSPGTIDPGYRGEVRILMVNHGRQEFHIRPGDRIAQLVIASYAAVEWKIEPALTPTARGAGGFGSTGV
ncbi:MAG TPA: dUTP diphosphatase [Bryobacterales bacterium]|jgi:dUTP pyrophosphatase|nr:dUTP diphosphatase [Bryobacterales bacterium]